VREALRGLRLGALVVSHLPNIRYLTGFNGSAGLLVVTPASCTLIVDFRYATAARALLASRPDIAPWLHLVVSANSFDDPLAEVLKQAGARRIGVEGAHLSVSRFNKLSSALAAAAPTPLQSPDACPALVPVERAVETLRMVKDDDEIRILREAGRRLGAVVPEVVALARPGRSELEVAADIEQVLRGAGFERPAFETIVASGPNSALPHARPTVRRLREGDGVVLDFGGVYDGYCVDLTRTVQLGDAGPDFRQLFAAVSEAQRAAIAAVQPGVLASAVDGAARRTLGRYNLAEAFGHATGHGLGIEVHEDPRIGKPSNGLPDTTLEPGMIFTIEPGAYIEGVGGVRIEDDVLVTESGCDVLTAGRGSGGDPVAPVPGG
jgi:Xaa-Pro aminopeptidase